MANVLKKVSDWWRQPIEVHKGWSERYAALNEVRDTIWFQLVVKQLDSEIAWGKEQLVYCKPEQASDLRGYVKANQSLKNFIADTDKKGGVSADVLKGRYKQIGRDANQFVEEIKKKS